MPDIQNAIVLPAPAPEQTCPPRPNKANQAGPLDEGQDSAFTSFMALLNQISVQLDQPEQEGQAGEMDDAFSQVFTAQVSAAGQPYGKNEKEDSPVIITEKTPVFSKPILDLMASIKNELEEEDPDVNALSQEMSEALNEMGLSGSEWDLKAVEAMLTKLHEINAAQGHINKLPNELPVEDSFKLKDSFKIKDAFKLKDAFKMRDSFKMKDGSREIETKPLESVSDPVELSYAPTQPVFVPVKPSSAQPASEQVHPAAEQSAPASAQPAPVAVQPAPVAVQPEPVAVQPEPVAAQPAPVAVQSEPVAAQPAHVAVQSAPAAIQPAPVAAQPEYTSIQPAYTPHIQPAPAPAQPASTSAGYAVVQSASEQPASNHAKSASYPAFTKSGFAAAKTVPETPLAVEADEGVQEVQDVQEPEAVETEQPGNGGFQMVLTAPLEEAQNGKGVPNGKEVQSGDETDAAQPLPVSRFHAYLKPDVPKETVVQNVKPADSTAKTDKPAPANAGAAQSNQEPQSRDGQLSGSLNGYGEQGEKQPDQSDVQRKDATSRSTQAKYPLNQGKDVDEPKAKSNFIENKPVFEQFFNAVTSRRDAAAQTPQLELPKASPFTQGSALTEGLDNVVRFIRANGEQRANLIVDPPAIGRISVELTSTSTGLEASVKVSSEQVRNLIQDHMTQLKMTLEQQGVQLTHFSVDVQQDNERRNQGQSQKNARRRAGVTGVDEDEGLDEEALFRVDLNQGLLYWVA